MEKTAGMRGSCQIRQVVYWFARAAVTQDPPSSGSEKFKIKASAGLVSSEDLRPWLAEGCPLPVPSRGLSSVGLCPNVLFL